jgi:hypothetical protein
MEKVARGEVVCGRALESWVSEISRSALDDIESGSVMVYSPGEYLEDPIAQL